MPNFTKTSRHGDVLVVEIDNPPVNALSPGVPEALVATLEEAERDPAIAAVVVRGAGRMFVAGADITALEKAAWGNEAAAPEWHDLLRRIEDCAKPVIMAVHGAALGGGLELAMAGHYRVAVAGAQIGQPEVNLGITPGGEGTQRLPRLAGVAKALDLCVTGKPISAADAMAVGIVDDVAGDDLTESAVAFARRVAIRRPHIKTRDRNDRLGDPDTNAELFAAARELAGAVRRFQTAPMRSVDAIEAATRLAFDEGCQREREVFLECLRGEQAKAMIHVFFAERALKKRGGPAVDQLEGVIDRLLSRYTAELRHLVDEGVPPDQIERALANFGMVPAVTGLLGSSPGGSGRRVTDADIVERAIYAVVNDCARAFEADASPRASDIDVTWVSRHGFPAWRGGPMFYADRVGLASVVDRVNALHRDYGDEWRPAPLLVHLAEAGRTFRDRDRSRQ